LQNFLRISKVAVLVNLFISLVIGVSASFAEKEPFYFIYIGMLLFGSLFVPLIIASALYYFIARKMKAQAVLASRLLQPATLFVAIQIGLLIWAALEVALDDSLKNIMNHYNREFGRMFWLTVFIAFAIPLTYFILDWRNKSKNVKANYPGASH
jgi:hypothetical protein